MKFNSTYSFFTDAIDSINNLLSQDDAFDCKYDDMEINNASKIPLCIENFVIQISLLAGKFISSAVPIPVLHFISLVH